MSMKSKLVMQREIQIQFAHYFRKYLFLSIQPTAGFTNDLCCVLQHLSSVFK